MTITSVLAAALPTSIVIKSNDYSDKGYASYKEDGGYSVVLGEEGVFSTLVKIEVEQATMSDKYVNLRFCYINRYCARKADDKFIVAESDQPQEDISKASCTLFEAFKVDEDKEVFYLSHVQSGGRLLIDPSTMAFFVEENPKDEQGYLTFVDWGTLVQLPKNVAFKGDNDKYLNLFERIFFPFTVFSVLTFTSDDPNDTESVFKVEQSVDGYVQIKDNTANGLFWKVGNSDEGVSVDSISTGVATEFWPIKIDDTTIALRSAANNKFCQRYSPPAPGVDNSLYASASTMTKEAKLQVKELVLGRKIYNVRYLMEYARIFDEAPFLAGTSTLINDAYSEASMDVEVSYEDSKSYTFSRGFTLTAGVKTEISCGVPFIAEGKIEVSFEISGNFQWDTTTTTTTTVTGSGAVPVPARSSATIEYVGTRGTCNVPYTYTQEDQSSTDGQTSYTDQIDGIYNGVSYYSFSFHVVSTEPLPT